MKSIINPAVHRSDGGINGEYRSQMTKGNLENMNSGRRWLVESFMSGLKRTTGGALNARTETGLFREAAFRVLAYAVAFADQELAKHIATELGRIYILCGWITIAQ
ncbi:hypothetical protein KOR42_54640 [Thalassoglobus neptunius]|uniref:Uncharacterized protein n=1 Tax=Thalassoglobus neptunius TaxID=1938619 RepID=A0A5C5UYI0_9PLAN|nr:hypothetical protein [Thalassoglobus neptunius]TWT30505.1 hypothetical protein KOR42_54640 [Thalassoglobus neptunius]